MEANLCLNSCSLSLSPSLLFSVFSLLAPGISTSLHRYLWSPTSKKLFVVVLFWDQLESSPSQLSPHLLMGGSCMIKYGELPHCGVRVVATRRSATLFFSCSQLSVGVFIFLPFPHISSSRCRQPGNRCSTVKTWLKTDFIFDVTIKLLSGFLIHNYSVWAVTFSLFHTWPKFTGVRKSCSFSVKRILQTYQQLT